MNTILNLMLIMLITVCIVDISGIINSIKCGLGKWLKRKPESISIKPFECSLCMTHWNGLVFLIFTGTFSLLNYAVLLLLAVMTVPTNNLIVAVRELGNALCTPIYRLTDKLNQ